MTAYTCGVVEDEELARDLLIRFINRHNELHLKWARESFSTLSEDEPLPDVNLLFLDLLDKPYDAAKVSKEIKKYAKQFEHTIITTAYPAAHVKKLGIRFTKLLNKPYTYDMFERVVNELLEELKGKAVSL